MPSEDRSFLSSASTVVTIICTLAGSLIAYLTLAATIHIFPFQDRSEPPDAARQKSVAVFRGGGANGQPGCANPSCAFIGVELTGFTAKSSVRCSFDSSVGSSAFLDSIGTVDADGFLRMQTENYYGNADGWVSAICEGVRGELRPW